MITGASPTTTNSQRALRWFGRKSRAPRLRTLSEFAEQEIVIPDGPYEGRRMRVDRQPFLRLLYQEIDGGRWRRKVITGSQQSGKSLGGYVVPAIYHLFEVEETIICGLPSMDMARDKWELDILPVIERSRYRDMLPRSGPGSRGGIPELIKFRNGAALKFMSGGGSDKKRAAFTSRVLLVTETDGMDESGESSREADKITQMEGRTRAFGSRASIYLECTVSTDEGRTWTEYQAGTASRIVVPCDSCGRWVSPERDSLVGWQDAESKMEADRKAAFQCPECGLHFTEADRERMNGAARIVHRGQEITPEGEIVGEAPDTDTLGFRWSAFNNLFVTAGDVAGEEWTASQSEHPENAERALKQFVWCEPVHNDAIERVPLSVGIVRGSAAGYEGRLTGLDRGAIPDGMKLLTAAIDVGKTFLHWSQLAGMENGCTHRPDYGVHQTPMPSVIGAAAAIEAGLYDLLVQLAGLKVQFDGILVDAHYETEAVRAAIAKVQGLFVPTNRSFAGVVVWPAIGDGNYKHPPAKPPRNAPKIPSFNGDPWYLDRQAGRINMDPDHWKHRVHESFLVVPLAEDGSRRPGSTTLFGADPQEHSDFARHINAEVFETEFVEKKGLVARWNKKSKQNHLFDCDYMNLVAHSMCSVERVTESKSPVLYAGDGRPDGRAW